MSKRNNLINYFCISDTHLGHKREIEFGRPLGYEEKIFKALKEMIKENAVLIHLGDVCIGNDREWHIKFLNCLDFRTKRILVLGNHDHRSNSWYYNLGWDFVCYEFSDKLFGKKILFSHIPQDYDANKFDINVHGHMHTSGREDRNTFKGKEYRLVSMEYQNYQPIKLLTLLNKK